MTDADASRPLLVPPGGGASVSLYGVGFTFKVRAEDSGGALAVVECEIPAKTLVKPHTHLREDECSIVLRGTVHARLGDEVVEVPAGSYLFKPRGVPHAIWNMTDIPAVIVEVLVPGGFERYFEEVAPILAGIHGRAPDFYELAKRYGVTVEDDWVEELEQRYGVLLHPAAD